MCYIIDAMEMAIVVRVGRPASSGLGGMPIGLISLEVSFEKLDRTQRTSARPAQASNTLVAGDCRATRRRRCATGHDGFRSLGWVMRIHELFIKHTK